MTTSSPFAPTSRAWPAEEERLGSTLSRVNGTGFAFSSPRRSKAFCPASRQQPLFLKSPLFLAVFQDGRNSWGPRRPPNFWASAGTHSTNGSSRGRSLISRSAGWSSSGEAGPGGVAQQENTRPEEKKDFVLRKSLKSGGVWLSTRRERTGTLTTTSGAGEREKRLARPRNWLSTSRRMSRSRLPRQSTSASTTTRRLSSKSLRRSI